MDKRLETFWSELLSHCNRLNDYNFTFEIEYYGILWMPWFIYIKGEWRNFSVNDISNDDLKILIELNLIEFIQEIEIEKEDLLTIQKHIYRIKTKTTIL
jgi:hypothetical protein